MEDKENAWLLHAVCEKEKVKKLYVFLNISGIAHILAKKILGLTHEMPFKILGSAHILPKKILG